MLHFFSSRKNTYKNLGSLLGCLICLIIFINSCAFNHSEHHYIIGQDSRWLGLNLMGKERNLSAFNNALLAAIAKEEHFQVKAAVVPNNELLMQLEDGSLQGILTSLQKTPLNENQLLFSESYFPLGPVLIIPTTAPLRGWNEKAKKIIAIQADSPILGQIEKDPSIQTKIYENILDALADLSVRRIDGAIFPAQLAHLYTKTFYAGEIKVATLPLTDEGIRLVALNNKQGKKLIDQFNEGLKKIKDNGTLTTLLDQWGLVNVENITP